MTKILRTGKAVKNALLASFVFELLVPKLCLGTDRPKLRFGCFALAQVAFRKRTKRSFEPRVPKRSLGTRSGQDKDAGAAIVFPLLSTLYSLLSTLYSLSSTLRRFSAAQARCDLVDDARDGQPP